MRYRLEKVDNLSSVYVKTYPNGTARYVLRKYLNGKASFVTLGGIEEFKGKLKELKARVKELVSGAKPIPGKRKTLGVLADELIALKNTTKKTITEDKRQFRTHLAEFRTKEIMSITPPMVSVWHSRLGKENGHVEANKCLQLMSSVFNYANAVGLTNGYNPCKLVKPYHESSRRRYITPEEMPLIVEATRKHGPFWQALFAALLYTGARPINVAAMKWKDLDLNQGKWVIERTKNGHDVMVPLAPRLVELLDTLPRNCMWVFSSKAKPGARIELKSVRKEFKKIKNEAGIPDLVVYDLKRTFATYQNELGISLYQISQSLGQATTRATPIYARSEFETLKNNVTSTVDHIIDVAKNGKKKEPKDSF